MGKRVLINDQPYTILDIDDIYPIGSLYLSVSSVSPSTLFGGTWQRVEEATVIGASSSSSSIAAQSKVGTTIGANSIILTGRQMPSHTHETNFGSAANEARGFGLAGSGGFTDRVVVVANENLREGTGASGEGEAVSVVQKSLVCYIWKRTA